MLRTEFYESAVSTVFMEWKNQDCLEKKIMSANTGQVKKIIESTPEALAEELKMLAWLYRNADRFRAVDFWASVMGPQVACILRNLEFSLGQGLGCGHGLFCVVEIEK